MRTLRLFSFAAAALVVLACAAGHGGDKPVKKPTLMEKKLAVAQKVAVPLLLAHGPGRLQVRAGVPQQSGLGIPGRHMQEHTRLQVGTRHLPRRGQGVV